MGVVTTVRDRLLVGICLPKVRLSMSSTHGLDSSKLSSHLVEENMMRFE